MDFPIPKFTTSIIDTGFYPDDPDTKKLYNEVGAFAKQGQSVVIFGPSGAGKEFLARHYYNTLVNAEFYVQWKEDWNQIFSELHKSYSEVYSRDELKSFRDSIKAGVFQSVNCATIYPHLAESILFGHEKGSFTDAQWTQPGLLETIKCGVLFMDEVGELPKHIQAKLLRAVDTEISEGKRILGKLTYSLKDLIIISATNQPRERLRDDYYYRMGIEVNIKGIDDRPKDVCKSLPYFIGRAIGKRKDYAAIIGMFGVSGIRNLSQLMETEKLNSFVREQSKLVTEEILNRKWPGNFRALRIAIESSVFSIENTNDLATFSRKFQKNLQHYIKQYSEDPFRASLMTGKAFPDTLFPSRYPDLDDRIFGKILEIRKLTGLSEYEKQALSIFLSSCHKTDFMRRDLQNYFDKHTNVSQTSEARIRGIISILAGSGILTQPQRSKNARYSLTETFLDQVNPENRDVFKVPEIHSDWSGRDTEIKNLFNDLRNIERIYINAPPRFGKSAFIVMFCRAMQKNYNFYYYPLGAEGIKKLFGDMISLLKSKKINADVEKITKDAVAGLKKYLGEIFKPKQGAKPVLIIDNAHLFTEYDDMAMISELADKWSGIIIILVGDKMDNAFQKSFYEIRLDPWGKQA